jgi:hypothetical protein
MELTVQDYHILIFIHCSLYSLSFFSFSFFLRERGGCFLVVTCCDMLKCCLKCQVEYLSGRCEGRNIRLLQFSLLTFRWGERWEEI